MGGDYITTLEEEEGEVLENDEGVPWHVTRQFNMQFVCAKMVFSPGPLLGHESF